ncbi:MAG: metalloregulator ArsR/SmtB family transcription factor [candidate division Zixibacteria bacterium]
MDNKQYSKYFKAFGDPSRLKILGLLSSNEMTVNDIVKKMDLSQPTVSRHLAILREAEIVTDRREGQKVFYSINKNSVSKCCCSFCDCLEVPVIVEDSKKRKKK